MAAMDTPTLLHHLRVGCGASGDDDSHNRINQIHEVLLQKRSRVPADSKTKLASVLREWRGRHRYRDAKLIEDLAHRYMDSTGETDSPILSCLMSLASPPEPSKSAMYRREHELYSTSLSSPGTPLVPDGLDSAASPFKRNLFDLEVFPPSLFEMEPQGDKFFGSVSPRCPAESSPLALTRLNSRLADVPPTSSFSKTFADMQDKLCELPNPHSDAPYSSIADDRDAPGSPLRTHDDQLFGVQSTATSQRVGLSLPHVPSAVRMDGPPVSVDDEDALLTWDDEPPSTSERERKVFSAQFSRDFREKFDCDIPLTTEVEAVESALSVLQGSSSALFTFDEKCEIFRVAPCRMETSSFSSMYKMLQVFAELGSEFRRLEVFIAYFCDPNSNLDAVSQAFGASLNDFLQDYRASVLSLVSRVRANRKRFKSQPHVARSCSDMPLSTLSDVDRRRRRLEEQLPSDSRYKSHFDLFSTPEEAPSLLELIAALPAITTPLREVTRFCSLSLATSDSTATGDGRGGALPTDLSGDGGDERTRAQPSAVSVNRDTDAGSTEFTESNAHMDDEVHSASEAEESKSEKEMSEGEDSTTEPTEKYVGFPRGVELLDRLYEFSNLSSEHSILEEGHSLPSIRRIFQSCTATFLQTLNSWIFHGVIEDGCAEFVFHARRGRSSSVEVVLPKFLSDIRDDVIRCGETLHMLREANLQYFSCREIGSSFDTPVRLVFGLSELSQIELERQALSQFQQDALSLLESEISAKRNHEKALVNAARRDELASIRLRRHEMEKARRERKEKQRQGKGKQKNLLDAQCAENRELAEAERKRKKEAHDRSEDDQRLTELILEKQREERLEFYRRQTAIAEKKRRRLAWRRKRHELSRARHEMLMQESRDLSNRFANHQAQTPIDDAVASPLPSSTSEHKLDVVEDRKTRHGHHDTDDMRDLLAHDDSNSRRDANAQEFHSSSSQSPHKGAGLGRSEGVRDNSGDTGSDDTGNGDSGGSNKLDDATSSKSGDSGGGTNERGDGDASGGDSGGKRRDSRNPKCSPTFSSTIFDHAEEAQEGEREDVKLQSSSEEANGKPEESRNNAVPADESKLVGSSTSKSPRGDVLDSLSEKVDALSLGFSDELDKLPPDLNSAFLPNPIPPLPKLPSVPEFSRHRRRIGHGHRRSDSRSDESEDDFDSLNDVLVPLEVAVDDGIKASIHAQAEFVDRLSVHLFSHLHEIDSHFLSIKRFMLMESGDTMDQFCSSLFSSSSLPHRSWLGASESLPGFPPPYLTNALELAAKASGSASDPHILRFKFHHSSNENFASLRKKFHFLYKALRGFDRLYLDYEVEWPLSLVITPEAIALANHIFCFLLKLKLVTRELEEVWSLLQSAKKTPFSKRRGSGDHEARLRRLHVFRMEAQHLIDSLRSHVIAQVINVCWLDFQLKMKKARHFLDLRNAFQNYLEQCSQSCFFPKWPGFSDCLNSMFDLILAFKHHVSALDLSRPLTSDTVDAIEKISSQFRSKALLPYRHLAKVHRTATSRSNTGGSSRHRSHLTSLSYGSPSQQQRAHGVESFLLRFDYNCFYESLIMR